MVGNAFPWHLHKIFEVILYGSSNFPIYSDGWSSEDKQNTSFSEESGIF